jgi:hypothetical protein
MLYEFSPNTVLCFTLQQEQDLRRRQCVTGTQALCLLSEYPAVPYGTASTGSKEQVVCNWNAGFMKFIRTMCCALRQKITESNGNALSNSNRGVMNSIRTPLLCLTVQEAQNLRERQTVKRIKAQ